MVSSGVRFSDALSVSPVAYRDHIPIFLTDDNGGFTEQQKVALINDAKNRNMFKETIVLGGTNSVSEFTMGFMTCVSMISSGISNNAIRLDGVDRYEASANIAQWAAKQGFSWNGVAFSSGEKPYDALSGSVIQGTAESILLLINSDKQNEIEIPQFC